MILLDTNVLSELMRARPEPAVVAWMDAHGDEVRVSAITRAEISLGIALLPEGRRRTLLAEAARELFEVDLAGRCLPFDEVAAEHFAYLVALRRRLGLPITTQDGQIAATARAHAMPVATRNAADFAAIPNLDVINPWLDA